MNLMSHNVCVVGHDALPVPLVDFRPLAAIFTTVENTLCLLQTICLNACITPIKGINCDIAVVCVWQ